MPNYFPKWLYQLTFPSRVYESSYLSKVDYYQRILIMNILAGLWWNLDVDFICIYLIMNEMLNNPLYEVPLKVLFIFWGTV